MADKKRDILEFVEQSNFEQFTPTRKILHNNFNYFTLYSTSAYNWNGLFH